MSMTIAAIFRYPVKGLSGERLPAVTLEPGMALPFDRRFAIGHGAARRLDPAKPEWMPKGFFLQLMANEKLAALETALEVSEQGPAILTVRRNGRQVCRGDLRDVAGRAVVEQFFAAYLGREARGQAKVVEAAGQPYSDTKVPFVSLVNRASVDDLERVVGRPVDSRRFRANLVVDGAPAWSELDWVGRSLAIGGVRLKVAERTGRCAAINVDPETAARDLTLPLALREAFGHEDCGVYATVVEGGQVSEGDAVTLA
jgi:uncharacterized protein